MGWGIVWGCHTLVIINLVRKTKITREVRNTGGGQKFLLLKIFYIIRLVKKTRQKFAL